MQTLLEKLKLGVQIVEKNLPFEVREPKPIYNGCELSEEKFRPACSELIFYLNESWSIRIVDPYKELKEAQKNGKQIQLLIDGDKKEWKDVSDLAWCNPPKRYRIKPEPVMIPLEAKDVPPGSVFKKSRDLNVCYKNTLEVLQEGVVCCHDVGLLSWSRLKESGWMILRPGEEWEKCEKDKL